MTKVSKSVLEVGDVVMLNSGGPDMTVREVVTTPKPMLICVWFCQKTNEVRQAEFPPETIGCKIGGGECCDETPQPAPQAS